MSSDQDRQQHLLEFLRACIAEDEQSALAVGDEDDWREYVADAGMYHRPASGFAASVGTPARVLAECDAKRKIIDRHAGVPYPNPTDEPRDLACTDDGKPRPPEWCPELRTLASVYADHPDYPEEWRP